MDTTLCPERGAAAELRDRVTFASTDGPVEHARICCAHGHGFLMPTADLARCRCSVGYLDGAARSRDTRTVSGSRR